MNVGLIKMNNMRTSICCIAKNEDLYIDEWINYHKKLGFDHFFIYQNNWRYEGAKKNCEYVTWLEMDGECKQKYAYVDFIANKSNNVISGIFFVIFYSSIFQVRLIFLKVPLTVRFFPVIVLILCVVFN